MNAIKENFHPETAKKGRKSHHQKESVNVNQKLLTAAVF